MYNKILVTTDGSEGSKAAIDHVSRIAKKFDSCVNILYVVDVRKGPQNVADIVRNGFEEIGRQATEKIRDELQNKDISAEAYIEYGIPHEQILEFSKQKNIDMIVISTHGRTGLDRLLIGSVTEKIVRNSKAPVLTVGREK